MWRTGWPCSDHDSVEKSRSDEIAAQLDALDALADGVLSRAAQLEEHGLTDGVLSLWVQHVEERERELTARENTIKARERNLGLREATVDASTRATLMEMLAKREVDLETRERVVVETEQQLGAERESSIKLKTALDARESELAARIAGFGRFVLDFERLEELEERERARCSAEGPSRPPVEGSNGESAEVDQDLSRKRSRTM